MKNIKKVHEKILQILLDYRKNHSDFTFQLRKMNNDNKLNRGIWFLGNEDYIFVGFYKVGCQDNKTNTIGFVWDEDKQYFEVVYRNIKDITEDEENFYKELVEYLKKQFKNVKERNHQKQYLFIFESKDLEKNLLFVLNTIRPYINDLLKKYNLIDKYMSSNEEFNKMLEKIGVYRNNKRIEIQEKKIKMKTKNIILYGPPGVGKTHNYQRLISMIESGKDEKTIFDTIIDVSSNEKVVLNQEIYKQVDKEKRVEFITFHQSYSYEDFIEGFRPAEDGNIKLEDGIFKLLANRALENHLKAKNGSSLLFNEAVDILLKEKIENEESVQINLKRPGSFYKIYDYNDRTIFFEKQNGDKSHSLSLKTLQKMYESGVNDIIKGGLAPYYNPLLEKLLNIKYKYTSQQQEEEKNYYIVIDEINRGNISKIFGELITLIEEDKRDTYAVTLPYSKEKFVIPSNLYIIATMNSTDKSIATIDIALRRRFTFLNMQPNSKLIVNEEAQKLMLFLNDYIQERLGRDFLLGHSYFMGENIDLEFIKKYKIRPLLEEYFYSDENLNIDKIFNGDINDS